MHGNEFQYQAISMRPERVVRYRVTVHTQWSDSGHVVFSDSRVMADSFRLSGSRSISRVLFAWKYTALRLRSTDLAVYVLDLKNVVSSTLVQPLRTLFLLTFTTLLTPVHSETKVYFLIMLTTD